jgi:hypothetical protein
MQIKGKGRKDGGGRRRVVAESPFFPFVERDFLKNNMLITNRPETLLLHFQGVATP